ncbi:MAG: hypothetical protein ACOYMF_05635 [Bacteroidales bacterium]
MTRGEIISELRQYFGIEELVCNHTFSKFENRSWQFLSTEFLHCLLIIRRDILKSKMICNNYNSAGGKFQQRGLRCNLCDLVKSKTAAGKIYLSAHILGNAGDFNIPGITAIEARKLIAANHHLLPVPVRMEEGVTWLHFDTYDSQNGQKITYFSV